MYSFFKLVRLPNLLIIVFTQFMVHWGIIYPILKSQGLELQLSNLHFILLVLSTVLIAAAGYAINDYFDVKVDRVNKPDRLVIDKGIKRRVAMGAHTVMNVLAIVIAFYVSYSIHLGNLALIHFICAAGLWFYSTTFKRQLLIGNIVIALFTALVPFVVALYDMVPCYKEYAHLSPSIAFKPIWFYVFGITFFAFITTLIREILKDLEDIEGDKEYGCNTLPIVVGIRNAKFIAILISVFVMAVLGSFQNVQWKIQDSMSFYYFLFAIQLPMSVLIYQIATAHTQKQFSRASTTIKAVMLLGVSYIFVFAYSILSTL